MSPAVSGPSVPPTSPEQGLAGSTGSVEPAEPADKERLPESRRSQILRSIIELVIAFVLAFGITWAIKTWVIQPYEVPSTSMEPTIMLKDRLMADSLTYAFGTIKTGDIVVFIDKTDQDRHLVKRVIAVEGQTVDFLDGRVVIDGQLLSEPYVHGKKSFPFTKTYKNTEITYPYTVPAGHIWVMGDNRENSTDSRYFGPIATDSVVGHALVKFWPPSSIGWL
jgi:signal peptidase I